MPNPPLGTNSMQWLNTEYGLGIDPKKLTIDYAGDRAKRYRKSWPK
jgi:hypothetical protein